MNGNYYDYREVLSEYSVTVLHLALNTSSGPIIMSGDIPTNFTLTRAPSWRHGRQMAGHYRFSRVD
jgi:hypothetical protein